MPEQQMKAYRRVVRNDNGIGLRIAYFDAITGEEITDLTGYILLDQGAPDFGSGGGIGGGSNDDDDDNDDHGGDSQNSRKSNATSHDGDNNFWDEYNSNPNVSKGSGDIIADLQAALANGQQTVDDIKSNIKQGTLEAFGLSKADPPGFMPRYHELDRFKTGAVASDEKTGNQAIAKQPNSTPSAQPTKKSYDSTLGAQPEGQSSGGMFSTVPQPFRSHLESMFQGQIDQFIGDGNPETIKQNLIRTIENAPKENLVNLIGTAKPDMKGQAEGAASIPVIGEGLLKGGIIEQIKAIPNEQIAQGMQEYRNKTGPSAPVPASKTQNIIDQQNAPNVQAAVKASKESGGDPLSIAQAWMGYDERNPEQAQALSQFFAKAGDGNVVDPASTAWCAAWLNGVFAQAGIEPTGSLAAKSFLEVGEPVDTPSIGDVVVFDRGKPGDWQGHVGIVSGINDDGTIQVIGGNQATDESGARGVTVNEKTFSLDRVEGFRRVTPNSVQNELSDPVVQQALANGQTSVQEKVTYTNPALAQAMDNLLKQTYNTKFPDPNVQRITPSNATLDSFSGVKPQPQQQATAPEMNMRSRDSVAQGIEGNTAAQYLRATQPQVQEPTTPKQSSLVDDLLKTGEFMSDTAGNAFGAVGDALGSFMPSTPTVTPGKGTDFGKPVAGQETAKMMSGPYALNDPERQRVVVQTVLGESAGEGIEGMMAVANVIKNRALSGAYPPDPKDVALQPKQFSTWNPVSEGGNNPAANYPVGSPEYNKALQIIEGVFGGTLPDNTYGAINYHTSNISPYWADEANTSGTLQIGNHTFYPKKEPDDGILTTQSISSNGGFMPKPAAGTPTGTGSRDTVAQKAAGTGFVSSAPRPVPSNSTLDSFSGTTKKTSGPVSVSANNNPSAIPAGTPTNFTSRDNPNNSVNKSSIKSNASSNQPTSSSKTSNTSKSSSTKNTTSSFMSGPTSTKTTPTTSTKTSNTSKTSSSKTSNTSKTTTTSNGFVKQTSSFGTTFQPGGR